MAYDHALCVVVVVVVAARLDGDWRPLQSYSRYSQEKIVKVPCIKMPVLACRLILHHYIMMQG